MHRRFLLGGLFGLALVLLVGSVTARWQKQTAEQAAKELEKAQFELGAKDATPVQLGVLSDTQRKHSKLYDGMASESEKPINELVAAAKDQGHLTVGRMISGTHEFPSPETPEAFVTALAGKSDAIVRGRVTQKASQLTEDNRFVFTDYEIVLSEVMKGNADLRVGTTITVTRPGGSVLIDGVLVTASYDAFAPLEVNGQELLLFLRVVADSGSYQTTTSRGGFELRGDNDVRAVGSGIPPGVLDNPAIFLAAVRAAK